MTAAELIAKLQELPQDAIVVMDLNDYSLGLWMAHNVRTQVMRRLALEPECFAVEKHCDDEMIGEPVMTVQLSPHK